MKKVLSLILAICFVLSFATFTSCEEMTEGAYNKLNSAIEKLSELDSIHYVWDMEMKVSSQGEELEVPMHMDIKAVDFDSKYPTMSANIEMEMLGASVDYEMFVEDGWYYVDMDGQQYKTKSPESLISVDFENSVDTTIKPIPQKFLNKVDFFKNSDGSESIEITIPAKDFNEIFDEYLENSGTTAQFGADVEIKNPVIKITIADGYVTEYIMNFDMEYSILGESATVSTYSCMKIVDPGKEVEITPPADYKDFEDISETFNDVMEGLEDFSNDNYDFDVDLDDYDFDVDLDDYDFDFGDEF